MNHPNHHNHPNHPNQKIHTIFIISLLSIFQLWFYVRMFSSLGEAFNRDPVINFDHSLIWYWIHAGREFFSSSHNLWGYDPFYMAGYPLSHIWNNSLPIQVLGIILFPIPPGVVSRLFLCMTIILAPLLIYFALKNLGVGWSGSASAAVLGTVYFQVGLPAFQTWVGMVSAAMVPILSLFVFSLFYRYVTGEKNHTTKILVLILAPLTLLVHKTAVIILGLPLLFLFIVYLNPVRRLGRCFKYFINHSFRKSSSSPNLIPEPSNGVKRLDRGAKLYLLLVFGVTLFVNSFWLIPVFKLIHYTSFDGIPAHWQGAWVFGRMEDWLGLDLFAGTNWIRGIIIVLSIFGLIDVIRNPKSDPQITQIAQIKSEIRIPRFAQSHPSGTGSQFPKSEIRNRGIRTHKSQIANRKSQIVKVLSLSITCFLSLIYLGPYSGLTLRLDPYRYMAPMFVFMLIPAGLGLDWVWGMYGKRGLPFRLLALFLFSLLIFLCYYNTSFGWLGRRVPLTTRVHHDLQEFIEYVKTNIDPSGRILMEDSGYWDQESPAGAYHNSNFTAITNILTGRHFIGGPYAYAYLKHHYVDFQDGRLLGRDITYYSKEELKQVFKVYNITWVVCWSDKSRRYFEVLEEYLQYKAAVGRLHIFRAKRNPSFFLKGSGVLSADYNVIRLKDVRPEDDEVVLSFHWLESFRTNPPLRITRKNLINDPIGFIRVEDPPAEFEISVE